MNSLDRAKLKTRARLLAKRPDSGQERQLELEVAVVLLGDNSVGIPVDLLREIVRMPPLTALPSLPPHFRGLVQIRGELISVIDLGLLLGLSTAGKGGFLVIVEKDGRSLGLATDGLAELREIYRGEMSKDFDDGSRGASGLIQATTRDLLSIIDLEKLLADDRIAVRATQGPTSVDADVSRDLHDPQHPNPSHEGGTEHDMDQ